MLARAGPMRLSIFDAHRINVALFQQLSDGTAQAPGASTGISMLAFTPFSNRLSNWALPAESIASACGSSAASIDGDSAAVSTAPFSVAVQLGAVWSGEKRASVRRAPSTAAKRKS